MAGQISTQRRMGRDGAPRSTVAARCPPGAAASAACARQAIATALPCRQGHCRCSIVHGCGSDQRVWGHGVARALARRRGTAVDGGRGGRFRRSHGKIPANWVPGGPSLQHACLSNLQGWCCSFEGSWARSHGWMRRQAAPVWRRRCIEPSPAEPKLPSFARIAVMESVRWCSEVLSVAVECCLQASGGAVRQPGWQRHAAPAHKPCWRSPIAAEAMDARPAQPRLDWRPR